MIRERIADWLTNLVAGETIAALVDELEEAECLRAEAREDYYSLLDELDETEEALLNQKETITRLNNQVNSLLMEKKLQEKEDKKIFWWER